jgi:hypothetical protein
LLVAFVSDAIRQSAHRHNTNKRGNANALSIIEDYEAYFDE